MVEAQFHSREELMNFLEANTGSVVINDKIRKLEEVIRSKSSHTYNGYDNRKPDEIRKEIDKYKKERDLKKKTCAITENVMRKCRSLAVKLDNMSKEYSLLLNEAERNDLPDTIIQKLKNLKKDGLELEKSFYNHIKVLFATMNVTKMPVGFFAVHRDKEGYILKKGESVRSISKQDKEAIVNQIGKTETNQNLSKPNMDLEDEGMSFSSKYLYGLKIENKEELKGKEKKDAIEKAQMRKFVKEYQYWDHYFDVVMGNSSYDYSKLKDTKKTIMPAVEKYSKEALNLQKLQDFKKILLKDKKIDNGLIEEVDSQIRESEKKCVKLEADLKQLEERCINEKKFDFKKVYDEASRNKTAREKLDAEVQRGGPNQ